MRCKRLFMYAGLFILVHLNHQVYAANDYTPRLDVHQKDKHVKLEWAVEMLDEDILSETGFEANDELPTLQYGAFDKAGGKYGGQSFTNEEKKSGEISLKVHDTYTNGQRTGNADLDGNYLYSNYSRAHFKRKYADRGDELSVSFHAKTTGLGYITPTSSSEVTDYGEPMSITFLEDVKIGQKTVKVSDPQFFKKYIDRGESYFISSSKGLYENRWAVSVNLEKSTITLNSGFTGEFKKGDNVLRSKTIRPITFSRRTINNKEWTLYNVNTKVVNIEDFNALERGFAFALFTETKDAVYIDDLKVGYATKVQLFKGSEKIYEGKLSDYEDKEAVDKEKPNKVANYSASKENGKQFITIENPGDNGTTYDYLVKAISNDGSGEYQSERKEVTVKSGIKGYSYVIDKNLNTKPSGVVHSIDGKIELSKSIYRDHYLHIQVIDNAGNASEISHIKLDKLLDINPPSINLKLLKEGWTNKGATIEVTAEDLESGLKSINYLSQNQTKNHTFNNNAEFWNGSDDTTNQKPLRIENGVIVFSEGISRDKLVQSSIFKDTVVDSTHYIEIEARGTGTLNARRSNVNGNATDSHKVTLNGEAEFKTYKMKVENYEGSGHGLIVEKIGRAGRLEIKSVKLYEMKEITNGQFDVSENGMYSVLAEDNAGNISSETISVSNIDKTSPNIEISQSTDAPINKDVTLHIIARDDLSGVKRVMYVGENLVKNGDFSQVDENWEKFRGSSIISKNVAILMDSSAPDGRNRIRQLNVFKNAVDGSVFYAEISARGLGILNARYSFNEADTDNYMDGYQQLVNDNVNYKVYRFPIEKKGDGTDHLIIEKIGTGVGQLQINNVSIFPEKEITNNKLVVTENGTYTIIVEDYAGNITTDSITVENIDKEPPNLSITPNTTEITNENITLTIDTKDAGSGLKSVKYIGENLVKNGDFSKGNAYWSKQLNYGEVVIQNGIMHLADNTVPTNKAHQKNAFKNSAVGSSYFAEIEARGVGSLNLRYGASGGEPQSNHIKNINNSQFETYTYTMERYGYSNDNFIIERKGNGEIEIRRITLYEQKEITDNTLVVTQNGTYTFVAEDKAGNITTKSIVIDNIDKNAPTLNVVDMTDRVFVESSDGNGSGINQIVYGWSENKESEPKKMIDYDGTGITKPETIGYHYLYITVEDKAGNRTNGIFEYIIDGHLTIQTAGEKEATITLRGERDSIAFRLNDIDVYDTRLTKSGWNLSVKSTEFASDGRSIGYLSHEGLSTQNSVTVKNQSFGNYENITNIEIALDLILSKKTKTGIYENIIEFTLSPL